MFRLLILINLQVGLIFFCHEKTFGQYFEKAYGLNPKTQGVRFAKTPDGRYIVLGNTQDSAGIFGHTLLNIDTNGTLMWQKDFIDDFNAFGYSITTINDGKIFILGTHTGVSYPIVAEIMVVDNFGSFVVSSVFPPFNGWGTAGVGMTNSSDSTVSISIYNDGFISNNYYSVISLNPDLSIKWNDFIGFDGSFTNANGLSYFADSILYSVVYYDDYFFSPIPLFRVTSLRKHDLNGQLILDSLYEFNCVTSAVTATRDGGVVICGTQDTSAFKSLVMIRLDSLGNVIWQKQFGQFKEEETNAVKETVDGGIIVLATVSDSLLPGQHNLLLLKTNSIGDSLWSREFGGSLDERGFHIEEDDSDLVIMGSTTSFNDNHIYIARTDSQGIIRSNFNIVCSSNYFCVNDSALLQLSPVPDSSLQITWSNGDTTSNTQVTTSGNYYAVVTDSNGNSIQTPYYAVYFSSLPKAGFAPDTLSLCQGDALIDTMSNEITNNYQWYLDGNIILFENQPAMIPQQAGMYMLVVSNFCAVDSASSFVDTLYPLPLQPVITGPTVGFACPGDSLLLTVTPDSSMSYQWFVSDNFTMQLIPGATDTLYYATDFGNFIVRIQNAKGCNTLSLPFTVNFDHDQVFVIPGGPTHFCEGGEVDLSVPSGTNFQWSNGDTTQIIAADSTGDYFVSFINDNGCPKLSDTVAIAIFPSPVVNLGADTILCSDSTLILDAGPGFTNYFWNDNTSGQTIVAASTGPFPDTSTFFVFVTDSNGCTNADTTNIVFDICQKIHEAEMNSISIFPNPVKSGESVSIINKQNIDVTVVISDMLNREILRKNSVNTSKIYQSSELPAGLYHYIIYKDMIRLSEGKLIVQ